MFYRIKVERAPADLDGPIIFVGNHPNSIIDPALVFVITSRKVTFLAKEPLFRAPVFGWILRGLDARRHSQPRAVGRPADHSDRRRALLAAPRREDPRPRAHSPLRQGPADSARREARGLGAHARRPRLVSPPARIGARRRQRP